MCRAAELDELNELHVMSSIGCAQAEESQSLFRPRLPNAKAGCLRLLAPVPGPVQVQLVNYDEACTVR